MTSKSSDGANPIASNPFRMLSISRQAENRPHKHLRFTLRNNIQVHTVDEAQMSIFREVIDQATDKESHSIAASEMFQILNRSRLDEELLAWIWEQTSTATFVTVGPETKDDGTFSIEQGIVALYLAQTQAGLELNEFSRRIKPLLNAPSTSSTYPAISSSAWNIPSSPSTILSTVSPHPDTSRLSYLYDEQPGLEVYERLSNIDQMGLQFAEHPSLELSRPGLASKSCTSDSLDLSPGDEPPELDERNLDNSYKPLEPHDASASDHDQPGLEPTKPALMSSIRDLDWHSFGADDQLPEIDARNLVKGSDAPEFYDTSIFAQPGLELLLPSDNMHGAWSDRFSQYGMPETGSGFQGDSHRSETTTSYAHDMALTGSAAVRNATELIATLDGTTTKEKGFALLNYHQPRQVEVDDERMKRKWKSFKGVLGGSKRLSQSVPIKYSDVALTAALEEAAVSGSLPLVEFCLSQGSDINYTSPLGRNKDGSAIKDPNKPRNRALTNAIEQNHVAVVQYMVTKCDQTALNLGLLTAIRDSNITIAKILLSKGADVNYVTHLGKECAFTRAIYNSTSRSELLDILYGSQNLKVDVLARGKAPLATLLMESPDDALRLLRAGADVNLVGEDGRGPLHVASEKEDVRWVQLLLENGAKVSAASKSGDTPLGLASTKGNVKIIEMLTAKEANREDVNNSFNIAAREGHLEALILLMEKGAEISSGSVIEASKRGQMECLRYLIHHGGDFDNGSLHMAVEHGSWEAVQLHLELGADMFTCAIGKHHKARIKGLESKRHSFLPHLIGCPNQDAGYISVLADLQAGLPKPDTGFLMDAIIYLQADILIWILCNTPEERSKINVMAFYDEKGLLISKGGSQNRFLNATTWVEEMIKIRSTTIKDGKIDEKLLAVQTVLLRFGGKAGQLVCRGADLRPKCRSSIVAQKLCLATLDSQDS